MQNLWKLYRERTEHSPLPVVITEGKEHYIRYANPAFRRLYRIPSKNVTGKPLAELLPEDGDASVVALLDRVFRSGKTESLPDQPGSSNGNQESYCSYTVWRVGDDEAPPGVMIQVVDTTESTTEKKQMSAITEALTIFNVRQHEAIEEGAKNQERLALAIRESEHRAKNSLRTVSALLGMYTRSHPEFAALIELKKIQLHIRTIASMHELLTRSQDIVPEEGKVKVSMSSLLKDLLPVWHKTIGIQESDLEWENDDFELPADRGIALALIINELLCNSIKNGGTRLKFQLKTRNEEVRLDVSDNGPGFPKDFDPSVSKSFGLKFIQSSCKRALNGKVSFSNNPAGGAIVTLTFPLEQHSSQKNGNR